MAARGDESESGCFLNGGFDSKDDQPCVKKWTVYMKMKVKVDVFSTGVLEAKMNVVGEMKLKVDVIGNESECCFETTMNVFGKKKIKV